MQKSMTFPPIFFKTNPNQWSAHFAPGLEQFCCDWLQTNRSMFSPSLSNQWPHSLSQIVGWEKIKSYTTTNQLPSASLRGLPSESKIQPQCEVEPVMMVWAGLCLGGGHSVNTNLLPLIHINAGGSKGHLQILYWYWIRLAAVCSLGCGDGSASHLLCAFGPNMCACVAFFGNELIRSGRLNLACFGAETLLLLLEEFYWLLWWSRHFFTSGLNERSNIFNIATTTISVAQLNLLLEEFE